MPIGLVPTRMPVTTATKAPWVTMDTMDTQGTLTTATPVTAVATRWALRSIWHSSSSNSPPAY